MTNKQQAIIGAPTMVKFRAVADQRVTVAPPPATCAVCATPLIVNGVQRAHVHVRDVLHVAGGGRRERITTCTAAACVANPWPDAGPTLVECEQAVAEVEAWLSSPTQDGCGSIYSKGEFPTLPGVPAGTIEWAPGCEPDPLDVKYDGVKLRNLMIWDAAGRHEGAMRPQLTPAQRAAVSAHWSAELRRKTVGRAPTQPSIVVDREED